MKNILICGVCGGMGRAAARHFLEKGYMVYGLDIADESDLPVRYHKVDLRVASEVKAVFEKIKSEADTLFAILHFTGFYTMNSLVEISEEEFCNIFDVNLFSVYRVNKIFLPLLREGSRILMTSSELAPLDPLPFTGLYAITKSAIEKYADSLRMELNLLGIHVSVIRPGAVKTGMIDASVASLERLCRETKFYQYNAVRFREIVDSVETKNVSPLAVARLAEKVLRAKCPKYVYNLNRNPLLRLLSVLPKHLQVRIIAGILRNGKSEKIDISSC